MAMDSYSIRSWSPNNQFYEKNCLVFFTSKALPFMSSFNNKKNLMLNFSLSFFVFLTVIFCYLIVYLPVSLFVNCFTPMDSLSMFYCSLHSVIDNPLKLDANLKYAFKKFQISIWHLIFC